VETVSSQRQSSFSARRPGPDGPRLFADIARAFPQLDIGSLPPGLVAAADEPGGLSLRSLHRRLGSNYRIFSLPQGQDTHKVGIALPDGAMISAKLLRTSGNVRSGLEPWIVTFAVCRHQRSTLLGLWARAPCGAVVVVRKGRRKLQPQRRRRAASRTRP